MGSTSWPAPNTDPNLDRVVSDVQYEQMTAMYAGNGLFGDPSLPSMAYADASGRNVKIRPSRLAMVHGHPFRSDASGVTLNVSTSAGARTDLVVLRLDRSTWTVTPAIREGVVGGGIPAPQQDADAAGAGTGLWELPIARVATPSGSAGITAAMVTDTAWYLGPPQGLVGRSGFRPPVAPGLEFTEVDTARRLAVLGTSWALIGENGPLTKLNVPHNGWDSSKFNVYCQRRNGWTYLQGLSYKTSPSGDLAAGIDAVAATLPDPFKPAVNFYFDGVMGGNTPIRLYANSDGTVTLLDHAVFKAANYIHYGPISYPST